MLIVGRFLFESGLVVGIQCAWGRSQLLRLPVECANEQSYKIMRYVVAIGNWR